jgi:hypothetical protein
LVPSTRQKPRQQAHGAAAAIAVPAMVRMAAAVDISTPEVSDGEADGGQGAGFL